MKFTHVAALILGAALALHGAPSDSTTIASATPPLLPGDPMAEVLPILQANYPDFSALHYHAGDSLRDLVARSNGKIEIEAPNPAALLPIFRASLPDSIEYWRLASFIPQKDWAQIASDFKSTSSQSSGAILDLRANATDDYHGAAEVLGLFEPADTSLYRYLPEKNDISVSIGPSSSVSIAPPIVVLTDGRTAGAAESLAGRLQADGALIVGEATESAQPQFQDHKLLDGSVLRIALPASQAGGASAAAVTPDIKLAIDEHAEAAVLTLIRDEHIDEVIQETAPRPRLSEAALVAGQDPEWDAYLSSLQPRPVLLSLPRIHDPVLTAALDSVRAIRLTERTPQEASTPDPAATPAPAAGSMQ
jgi:hypothetical protein